MDGRIKNKKPIVIASILVVLVIFAVLFSKLFIIKTISIKGNHYYTEDEVKPEATPTPESTVTPEITEKPDVTATPEVTESPEATVTPEITEESEETATPTPTEKVTPTPKERVTIKRSTKNK